MAPADSRRRGQTDLPCLLDDDIGGAAISPYIEHDEAEPGQLEDESAHGQPMRVSHEDTLGPTPDANRTNASRMTTYDGRGTPALPTVQGPKTRKPQTMLGFSEWAILGSNQ